MNAIGEFSQVAGSDYLYCCNNMNILHDDNVTFLCLQRVYVREHVMILLIIHTIVTNVNKG